MGLDVIAICDASKISDDLDDESLNSSENNFRVNPAADCSWNDGISAGFYQSPQAPFHFYAGSYSSYNHFRLSLFLTINKISQDDIYTHAEKYQGLPFFQLVYSPDDTAVFGPVTSANLFKMFLKYQVIAPRSLGNPMGYEVYKNFTKAFHLASKNGMVIFR